MVTVRKPLWIWTANTFFIYMFFTIIGRIRDFIEYNISKYLVSPNKRREKFKREVEPNLPKEYMRSYKIGIPVVPPPREGYADLLPGSESFYARRIYIKVQYAFNRPICSNPGSHFDVLLREGRDGGKSLVLTGKTKRCLNLGSYNYLGFANNPPHVTKEVLESIEKYGIGTCSPTNEYGYTPVHREVETRIAKFMGKEDAVITGMGFATNTSIIPTLITPKTLIISDSLNHTSMVIGARCSCVKIKVYEHGNMEQLEKVIRVAISEGYTDKAVAKYSMDHLKKIKKEEQEKNTTSGNSLNFDDDNNNKKGGLKKTRSFGDMTKKLYERFFNRKKQKNNKKYEPWDKIIILVEGIYSMEGETCDLKKIVEIKKKYGTYLYVDEAHSVGGCGKTGRGICEFTGVDPKDVDVLMGTFTKSFGSVGGYVASSKEVIDYIRVNCGTLMYGTNMPVGCAQQIISAHKVITGEDGTNIGKTKLKSIWENSNFFREGLKKRGFEVVGDIGSPVMVALLYNPVAIGTFSKMALNRGVAVVTVGAPACDPFEGRVRFCISADHKKEDLEKALDLMEECGDLCFVKHQKYRDQSFFQTLVDLFWN